MSGFLIVLHFNEWFIMWVGLEIIMFGFLIISFEGSSVMIEEACYKYFFVQSLGSGVLLGMFYIGDYDFVIELVLLYKLGVGPFYFWYLAVMRGLGWCGCYLLMILQKLVPLLILREMDLVFGWLFVVFSLVMGVLGSIGQVVVKDLLAFSSLHYMGWILMMLNCSSEYWFVYFMIYSLMMLSVIFVFFGMNINSVGLYEGNVELAVVLFMLGGIPPMIGFVMKWMGFFSLVEVDILMLIILVFTSVVMCYVYVRMGLNLILMDSGSEGMMWFSGVKLLIMNVFSGGVLLLGLGGFEF